MEQIKNDQLTVEISAHGAELKSIKDAMVTNISGMATRNSGADSHLSSSLSLADCGRIPTASATRSTPCLVTASASS